MKSRENNQATQSTNPISYSQVVNSQGSLWITPGQKANQNMCSRYIAPSQLSLPPSSPMTSGTDNVVSSEIDSQEAITEQTPCFSNMQNNSESLHEIIIKLLPLLIKLVLATTIADKVMSNEKWSYPKSR